MSSRTTGFPRDHDVARIEREDAVELVRVDERTRGAHGRCEAKRMTTISARRKNALIFVRDLAGLFDRHAERDDEITFIAVFHRPVVVADSDQGRRAAVDAGVTVAVTGGKDEMRGDREEL